MSNYIIYSKIFDVITWNKYLEQVITKIYLTPFSNSMQLNENTNISQCSQLLAFVRYVYSETTKEEILFCQPLLKCTKTIDVFEIVLNLFSKHKLSYKKLDSLCIDSAPAMLDKSSGFIALIKKEIPDVVITHNFIHRHSLASKN